MREIKFRAWEGWYEDNMEMLYSDKFDCLYKFFSHEQRFQDIMQFTGLKDKNGKDIYEGDIVKIEGRLIDVRFYNGMFNVGGNNSLHKYDVEVVGNIYQNPELIVGEKE